LFAVRIQRREIAPQNDPKPRPHLRKLINKCAGAHNYLPRC
jgi:hypothetical protein